MKRIARIVALLLGAVALVGLAATTTLKNETGTTATGVVITFSEAVQITSYDKSVFPTQSAASGESESFTFSGGTLATGGAFQVTWSPEARLRSTKWITSGSGEVTAASASAIPTTYEEIMAKIAHYPGPDESLYVPAEGEAIWLTDLEGHADIYDSDSIKINHASWLDKSQITKVEVYRNGIKMRFLPDKLDVLTNEQMKTFDGNPEEHSPKSDHTDHAIMGYAYEIRVTVADGTTHQLAAIVKSAVRFGASHRFASVGATWFNPFTRGYMTDEQVGKYLQGIKADGFVGVQVDVTLWSDGIN
ncbi:MAG: hypothetical protein NTY63_09225, partial [Candidatus Bipolaricaulota bacterium]|nr:hypothetical protein [Candidatus Bipolaricaulota bacterium]